MQIPHMRLSALLFVALLAMGCHSIRSAPPADGFEPIFDGRTLNGWQGQDMSFWSVEDGAITGTISPEHAPKLNQYLIWQGGMLDDFELKLTFRLRSTNSPAVNGGFQFRSRRLPNGDVAGYQVDNNYLQPWKARLYDEFGRHDPRGGGLSVYQSVSRRILSEPIRGCIADTRRRGQHFGG